MKIAIPVKVAAMSRVTVDFVETKSVANIPWVCDVILTFDNGAAITKN